MIVDIIICKNRYEPASLKTCVFNKYINILCYKLYISILE